MGFRSCWWLVDAFLVLAGCGGGGMSSSPPSVPGQATVDFNSTYQTIRGFGGSTAWLGALTTQQAAALFSPTGGLGLSILRVRIDPEGSPNSSPPYVTGEWAAELTNAIEEHSENPNAIVFATPWTPPPAMKISSTSQPFWSGSPACGTGSPGSNYCGGYLNPSDYTAYANYLEDFVTYFANNGIKLYGISMQNEPDYADVDFESCYWTPQQMDTWVAQLTANGATNPIATKLIMPESFRFNPAQSDPTLNDPRAVNNVSIVGGHLYGVSPSFYATARNLGKEIWMTEHYFKPAGAEPAIGDALSMAEEIHNGMTVGDYNAYVWWWIWDAGINYGLINSSTASPAPTYYGFAIGQFSKFIQPGFVRVSATASPVAGVYLSAYSYSGSLSYPYHYVIVAINSNAASETLSFTLDHASNVAALTPYETTPAGGLMKQSAVDVPNGQFTYSLPAQSIVTFAQ